MASLRKNFAQRLRELREEQGLTPIEVAVAIGVDQSQYYAVERGKSAPRFDRLSELAKALRCDESDLFNFPGSGPRHDLREQIRIGPPAALADLRDRLAQVAPLPARPSTSRKPRRK
jgi:transcriptional regulator with XRE-family HTH domain